MGTIADDDALRLGLSPRARELHERSTVIDLHVDCILQQRLFGYDVRAAHDRSWRFAWPSFGYDLLRAGARLVGHHRPFFNHADIPRMIRAGYSCVAFGIHYWPVQSEAGWEEINRQIDYFFDVLLRDDRVVCARDPEDVRRAKQLGKLAAFLGVEGVHCLGERGRQSERRRLERLKFLFDERGVRYVTLAHFSKNDVATHGFGPGSDQRSGLRPFGRELVAAMNDIGMLVDVAHVNDPGVIDVCACSRAPVVATHSGLRGAYPGRTDRYRRRMLSDEAARAIASTGGVIGLIMSPHFLCGRRAPLDCAVEHLRYGQRLFADEPGPAGRYFAFGSDFDGWLASIPDDIDDVADMPRLTERMLAAGLGDESVQGLWGDNFLRAWEGVLAAATR